MTFLQALVLGALQGATEFLPISSSGHLVIVPALLGWRQPSIAFDVLLHAGTLVAVAAYFRSDLLSLAAGALSDLRHRMLRDSSRLILMLLLATVPAAVAGILFDDFFESLFASPVAAGGFLLATAMLLVAADGWGRNALAIEDLTWGGAVSVGAAQALAIAPGVSRSGATIVAGMLFGLRREAAARFSFLLSMPIIAGTFAVKLKDLSVAGVTIPVGVAGFTASAVVGYACIAFLLKYLVSHRLRAFAVYCAAAGALTISFFLLKSGS